MKTDVCPASHAGFLSSSFRQLIHNPQKILGEFVAPGQTAADIGCGPGFFTLPLAQMVGENGTVVAADLQSEMLEKLRARATKLNLKIPLSTIFAKKTRSVLARRWTLS